MAIGTSALSSCNRDNGGNTDGVSLAGSWFFVKADSSSLSATFPAGLEGDAGRACCPFPAYSYS